MNRKTYPILWWQLWRFNHYWGGVAFRYKWMRDWWFGYKHWLERRGE